MDIYNFDPETGAPDLDPEKALRELRGVGAISNEGVARRSLGEIQTAAMLDIASSLRVLALDAYTAMNAVPTLSPVADESDEPEPEERDFLVVGDLVHREGGTTVGEVIAVGITEDAPYADIAAYPREEGDSHTRIWQADLVRLRGDERPGPDPLAEVILPTGEKAPVGDDGMQILPADPETLASGMVDDLDEDFEGDDFTDSESALEKLRSLEKPAKKKAAPKKGKKS